MSDLNDYLVEASMYITKATHDGKVMRWAATNSDTDFDSYEERMSLELYKNFIDNIKNDVPVPEIFRAGLCSEFWDGGMPYLSISHYSDMNGDAVPGEPIQLYVEGNKLKAKGILFDSPLGHAVWRSLKEDKNKTSDKIRISIGFLDLAHKHGENGELFVRDSLTSTCPQCKSGVGEKIYVKGYLVHLALTRVPVNKRTEMVLEEKSMPKQTRKDDAKSIVGEELADELDTKSKVHRSEALVEMSETPTEVEPTSPDVKNTPETSEEPVVEEIPTEKSESEIEKMDAANLPYGGAVSMKEAQKIQKSKEEMWEVMDMFSVFQNVVWNIVDRNDVMDKKAAVQKAIGEFQSLLAAKAMVEFGMVERSEKPVHPLQVAIDALLANVDNSLALKGDVNEKLASINLQELGMAITDYVTRSVGNEPAPAQDNDVVETIKNLIQPLVENVSALRGELDVLKARSAADSVTPTAPRIPAPRTHSLPPSLLQKSEPAAKPGSLRDIINKSVGIKE